MKKFKINWTNRLFLHLEKISSFSLIKKVNKNLLFYSEKELERINYWIDNFLWDRFSKKALEILSYDATIETFKQITDILDEKSTDFEKWKKYIELKELKRRFKTSNKFNLV
ncbi:Uncharacterised protein [Mycoplasmopsis citelli]|uniref:Uncharacterized protein n=1 Tax=Mycoplasmopsis citelli TaxID=171281 RepID=A0A449B2K5_9BACT|nr:hypothetical protein [Mycoplasmopsis citelli]VEU74820.1 Uncharacterised protein [Mycoplasmopsis citelli]VEU75080.1 Uncharacterised protein [Mycoplasmopsis citelli]